MKNNSILTDHTLIIKELERSIKFFNWGCILSFLPKGSFLVGGYIRDIILGRMTKDVDIDIVVPANAIDIGQKISTKINGKLIVLDKKRQVVRIIFNNLSIDIANQISSDVEKDLQSRDFSINSIAFSFFNKCLIDPLNGIKDIEFSLLRTYSKSNLLNDPLRILRCFRFVSELNFNIDPNLISFIKQSKGKLNLVAKERINYEIQRIVRGSNAWESVLLLKKHNIFGVQNAHKEFFVDLSTTNYEEFNQSEKKKFLPLFLIFQILDEVKLENYQFSKSDILKTKLLRKWLLFLKQRDIAQLNELERFELHNELEHILPSFILYLPKDLQSNWLKSWRDKDDKLFHPANLINGDLIKKHLNINESPQLGRLLYYLSMEFAYKRLNNFDEAIYKAKLWIKQNAPKCD